MDVQSTITEIDEVTKKIEVVIPVAQVESQVTGKMSELYKKVSLKGFRKGKAPKQMIDRLYGNEAYYECVSDIVDSSLKAQIKEHDFQPIVMPDVSIDECKKGGDVKYTATVILEPKPEITGYDAIAVEVEVKKEITDVDIDKAIDVTRNRLAKVEKIEDRNVANEGDVVVLSCQVQKEGQEPTKPESIRGTLGAEELPNEIDEAVKGMIIGEKKVVQKVFTEEEMKKNPEAFSFNIELIELYQKIKPELTDEFVVELGFKDIKTVEEYKKDIKTHLERGAESHYKDSISEAIMAVLREKNQFVIPQVMIDEEIRQLIVNSGSINLKDVNVEEIDLEPFRPQLGNYAKNIVQNTIILKAIADKENLKAEEADIEARVGEMAKRYGVENELIKNYLFNKERQFLTMMEIVRDKVFNFLRERTTVNHKEAEVK